MIVGIGIDLVRQARVARMLERFGERLLSRVLTARERAALHGPPALFVAARLAAKEAAFKALGTGWAAGVSWGRAEVLNLPSGAPELRLNGAARARMEALGGRRTHVSLTHTREHAAAVVVIES
ncbi:MAG: holo-[acyl-carrier-protein] synthase [Candidatus Eisenbacteria bacterium]|nr:holo-[acyl-carrier-protein] synthase [Candidatus Eisenbacteria bacterium]